ncbi:zinc-binding dehydrogenase [Sphingomonas solaris]|uniref:Zinc-binding dehydrogenase n=1 Tax=Alterirhizorhabdus solaris TaxID=2529389 RepID=A0A558R7U7_9SPHN|nr:zinc-binding dehydrogenase [Sphingomonas solaris]TVV75469.1 zinc-binding dehydrogenase [Sphingomonas solaris]
MDALTGLELRSLITVDGELRVSLEQVPVADPAPGEVVVRMEAAPINPSDLGLLLGPADPATFRAGGEVGSPVLIADIPRPAPASVAARIGQSLGVGNEGAGTVIRAGADVVHLVGRKVALLGGPVYTQYRVLPAKACTVLPEDATAAEGAALTVNPLTALAFVETMRLEGHSAIIHTAAASNLGQMLVRICLADGVPLVNVVRSAAQAALLRDIGATHVVDSTAADFRDRLVEAIADTGATIAFDAIGGGTLAGDILNAMETVASRSLDGFTRYGSTTPKQVYIYGMLDTGPTVLERRFGFSWGMGGWLLFPFLQRVGAETGDRLRKRVLDEYRTTFASRYTATIGLADMLDPKIAADYTRKATGTKYLVDPSR